MVDAGAFEPEDRVELLDGFLVAHEPQGSRHAARSVWSGRPWSGRSAEATTSAKGSRWPWTPSPSRSPTWWSSVAGPATIVTPIRPPRC